jgi:cell division protein ZipA
MRGEWMIALGILVVAAVVLDCVRRIRAARRDTLQLAINMKQGMAGHRDPLDGDTDIGNVRVSHRDMEDSDEVEDLAYPADGDFAESKRTGFSLSLSQTVPILMDDVSHHHSERIEPGFSEEDPDLEETQQIPMDITDGTDLDDETVMPVSKTDKPLPEQPELSVATSFIRPVLDSAVVPLVPGESDIVSAPRVFNRPADRPPPRREPPVMKASKPVIKAQQERARKMQMEAEEQQGRPQQLALEDYVLINVMARDKSRFSGAAVLEALLACDLRYGHHNVFHYYTGEDREHESLFSVVNILKPGTFDLNRMEGFNTPGIGMILHLPVPMRSIDAFEIMLDTARKLAEQLNGELRDEQRNGMTGQTIEHYRQRVLDFEMQLQLRAR